MENTDTGEIESVGSADPPPKKKEIKIKIKIKNSDQILT